MAEKTELTLREYLTLTEKMRCEEEMTRPRVEIWPDEWVEWVEGHRKTKRNRPFCDSGAKASPLCPIGIH